MISLNFSDSKRKSVSDFNIKLLKDPGTNKNNIKKSQAVISSNSKFFTKVLEC